MNQETQFKLQAYLDGELSDREAQRLAELAADNTEAKNLVAELSMAKTILAGNEPALSLPESREFYWSKIHREIQRAEQLQPRPENGPLFGWRKYLAPLAGTALVVFLGIGMVRFANLTGLDDSNRHLAEVENLSEDTGSFSFRSHSENMFVVWVYDKDQDNATDPESMDEAIPQ